jgi:DNA processing protein
MDRPACLPFERFAAMRPERLMPRAFERLWVSGSLEGLRRPTVAVVGTRAATAYGKSLSRRFSAELSAAGCCIISGLALGIDAEAHRGALDAGGPTIGVLGSGHDAFFPARNRDLAQQMIQRGGAVLSPYEPAHPAYPSQFLERNGVVAALSDAVVVIEAPARSGALNTATWAAGRIPVFAVPGDVDRAHVAGCHALIRDGAILARCPQDVLDDMRLVPLMNASRESRYAEPDTAEDPLQRRILDALREGERSLDDLLNEAGDSPARVLAALSVLEVRGSVETRPGLRYSLRQALD